MLVDAGGTIAVSNLGWVDHGSLWTFSLSDGKTTAIPLGDAKHLSLHEGKRSHFSVVHHGVEGSLTIAVHRFPDVATPAATVAVAANGPSFTGADSAWDEVPSHYTAFLKSGRESDYALIRIDGPNRQVQVSRFAWFTNADYDRDYQGIVGVTEIPGDDLLLVSVQRDSRLVIHDPRHHTKRGMVALAHRGGNSTLSFRQRAPELWAVDYDTLLKLEPGSWRVLASRQLQDGSWNGSAEFVGSLWFDSAETTFVVARPFSRDVVSIDPHDLAIKAVARTGGQPLEAAVLGGQVIARDWQTGRLLQGRFTAV